MNKRLTAYAALSSAMVFWGASFVATKVALETFTVSGLIFIRFGFSALLFIGVKVFFRSKKPFTVTAHFKLFVMALFDPGLFYYLQTWGLKYTTASKASLIIATVPVAVLIFARLLLGERIRPAAVIGVVFSLTGIGMIVYADPAFQWCMNSQFYGDLLMLGAMVSAALYIVAARDLGRIYSAWDITATQILYGALFYAPFFFMDPSGSTPGNLSLPSIIAVFYLVVFATFLGFLFNNYGLTQIQASRASVFMNGIPVSATITAWVILDERLTGLQMIGAAMVLSGVWMANRRKKI